MLKQNLSSYLTKTIGEPPADLDEPVSVAKPASMLMPPVTSLDDVFVDRTPVSKAIEEVEISGLTPPVGMLRRNRTLLIVLGCLMCVTGAAIYAGLAYWWFVCEAPPVKHPAEAVSMLNLQESNRIHQDTQNVLQNIQDIKQETGNTPEPATVADNKDNKQDEKFALQQVQEIAAESTGRPDPFDPLVSANGPLGLPDPAGQKERDVVQDLTFTGFIGDITSKDKVAIIKMNDPTAGSQTLIKKTGESFMVEGKKVVLKAISKTRLRLSVGGETREIGLQAYQEMTPSASSSGGADAGGSGSPGASGSGSATSSGASGGISFSSDATKSLTNLAKVAAKQATNANNASTGSSGLTLQEPKF